MKWKDIIDKTASDLQCSEWAAQVLVIGFRSRFKGNNDDIVDWTARIDESGVIMFTYHLMVKTKKTFMTKAELKEKGKGNKKTINV